MRHAPYFEDNISRDDIVAVCTTDGDCVVPEGWKRCHIGRNEYMNGENLPTRLLDTIRWGLENSSSEIISIFEYDSIVLSTFIYDIKEPPTNEAHVWCHFTGGKPFDAKANWFSHNPWIMNRMAARALCYEMPKIIAEGHCSYGKADSSPDVFWGYACERSGVDVHHSYWRQYTRNRFDLPGHLDEAKTALGKGLDLLHGCKTAAELEYLGL